VRRIGERSRSGLGIDPCRIEYQNGSLAEIEYLKKVEDGGVRHLVSDLVLEADWVHAKQEGRCLTKEGSREGCTCCECYVVAVLLASKCHDGLFRVYCERERAAGHANGGLQEGGGPAAGGGEVANQNSNGKRPRASGGVKGRAR